MPIDVRPLSSPRERRIFLEFPWRVYRDDPVWVPPLLPERRRRIDPARSPFFQHGQAEFFVAWRGKEPVGTICAAEDYTRNDYTAEKEGIFGFFECVEEYDVAAALFRAAAEWGREHGLASLLGPFHLDYEDSYGILLEGFDQPQVLLCGHTPPYYRDFVERCGLVRGRAGDNIALALDLRGMRDDPRTQRIFHLAQEVERRGRVSVRPARLKDWDAEIAHFIRILNKGLAVLPGHVPWDPQTLAAHAEAMRPILDPDLVIFGLVDGEPVGLVLALPDINEAVRRANGLRRPWDYPRLWWYGRRPPACLCLKSIAVDPAYWRWGVYAVMIKALAEQALARGYQWLDMSITAEDNPTTPRLAGRMGGHIYRRYGVYRLQL